MYGEAVDSTDDALLCFPQRWGVKNEKEIYRWIDPDLMNDQHKSDLMMSTEFDCSDDDSDDNGKTPQSAGSSDF